jgi:hypothetical protein
MSPNAGTLTAICRSFRVGANAPQTSGNQQEPNGKSIRDETPRAQVSLKQSKSYWRALLGGLKLEFWISRLLSSTAL